MLCKVHAIHGISILASLRKAIIGPQLDGQDALLMCMFFVDSQGHWNKEQTSMAAFQADCMMWNILNRLDVCCKSQHDLPTQRMG